VGYDSIKMVLRGVGYESFLEDCFPADYISKPSDQGYMKRVILRLLVISVTHDLLKQDKIGSV
jgi:hypothetical protein